MANRERITKYLIEKYNAQGLVLYGSRAERLHRELSDWDIYIFTDKSEGDIEDYCEFNEFEGESLEVSIYPLSNTKERDFILETSMHPIGAAEVLYDSTDGLIHQIVERSAHQFQQGPKPDTERKRQLRLKIMRKFMRKVRARLDQDEVVFVATAQFFMYAIRSWFEVNGEWPLPPYKALSVIRNSDEYYARNLEKIFSYTEDSMKIDAMEKIYYYIERRGLEAIKII